MIYARSRRPVIWASICGLVLGVALGAASVSVALERFSDLAAIALGAGSVIALGGAAWGGFRLRTWPAVRLCLFRDRLLLIRGDAELTAVWEDLLAVSLAGQVRWRGEWEPARIGRDVHLTTGHGDVISFRPASLGLPAVACRDLLIRLRDTPQARASLPEFDSILDTAPRPTASGQRPAR